jgi:mono/diheme cytochrome c family protein
MLKRNLIVSFLLAIGLALVACEVTPTPLPPTQTSAPASPTAPHELPTATKAANMTPEPEATEKLPATPETDQTLPLAPAQGGRLTMASNDWFSTAGNCAACHQKSIDEAGNDVTNSEYWRSTMMANAALDPYYLSGVSIELSLHPDFSEEIENTCSVCHMPMAHFSDAEAGQSSIMFGGSGYLDPQNPLHTLAMDAVSCTVCHQVQSEGFGEAGSFSGGMAFDMNTPSGERSLFGPFDPHPAGSKSMAKSSGFMPLKGEHLSQSEMCATCHDLYTPSIASDGTLNEELFPEQTPYNEWQHSDYLDTTSCIDCHMPKADGEVNLSILTPSIKRSPYSLHDFTGANLYMLDMLKNFGADMGVQADVAQFDATIARTTDQMETRTAEMTIADPQLDGTTLGFDVFVSVLTGHKFPTGYPSRRAWLHVTVKDSNGDVVFESGAVNENGAIIGNDNDGDPTAYEPHYDQITSSEQVQIYEPIMGDEDGNVTTTLLSAFTYLKDNRLLPNGFDKTNVPPAIVPHGAALEDDNFIGGSDTVTYRIDIGDARGPFLVDIELLYQSISYRWAMNVADYDTPQAQDFITYYDALPNMPVQVSVQSIEVK